jgi:hypothetical protein
MPLLQFSSFSLFSQHISADEMTSRLGLEPDEVTVRGSRFTEPRVIPVFHRWKVECRDSDLRVDEQIARLLERLKPHTDRIAGLSRQLATRDGGAVLQVVRYFNDTDPDLPRTPDSLNLFGWHLDRAVMDFLMATGAELDVDEYDLAAHEDDS